MFIYTIDTARSKRDSLLTVCITSPKGILTLDERNNASLLSDPLIRKLVAEENKHDPLKKRFDYFRVRPGSCFHLLQELAATGNLYIDAKKAIVDFYARITLDIEVLVDNGEALLQAAMLHHGAKKAMSSCDFFIRSRPQIAIMAPFISFFHDDIEWDDLMVLKKAMLTEEEFTKWRKATSISYRIVSETKAEAAPLLILQDPRGIFCSAQLMLNGKSMPLANTPFENQLLEAGYQYKPAGTSTHFCPHDRARYALMGLLDLGWQIQDSEGRALHKLTVCELSHSMQTDVIEIGGRIQSASCEGTVKDYIQALKKDHCVVALSSHTIGLISDMEHALLAREIEFVSDRPILKKTLIGLIAEAPFMRREALPLGGQNDRFIGSLRPYQHEGVSWLVELAKNGFGGILADDMGLGKTIQAICFLTHLQERALNLIVVPTSLLCNWQREMHRFFPSCPQHCHHGADRMNSPLPKQGVILTTYGTLRQDIELFSQMSFTCCILDEAQMIKNESSDTARAANRLKTSCMITMTGTPIENSPRELFSQFRAIMPDLLSKDEIDKAQDPMILKRLKMKIKPFILRRKKEDVAKDLPELIEQTIVVELADDELRQYKHTQTALKQGLVSKIAVDGASKHRMEILEAILRLRQMACHPLLIEQLAAHGVRSSTKFDLVMQDIQTLVQEGKKILVFTQFAQLLTLMSKEAAAQNIPCLVIEGQTKNRQNVVDRFQTGSEQLLLMTMKAGGVGLNLTAADAVLLYDPWWNEAQEAQAIARAHRIGRSGSCLVKRYIAQDTIEEKIQALQREKKKIELAFLDGIGDAAIDGIEELLF